ncbi:hypothetical protein HMI54_014986 [Coelomomyces lativittatus]|nr:hypothetical protein HMI54_014986 [Coelomomyces lativittatus]
MVVSDHVGFHVLSLSETSLTHPPLSPSFSDSFSSTRFNHVPLQPSCHSVSSQDLPTQEKDTSIDVVGTGK